MVATSHSIPNSGQVKNAEVKPKYGNGSMEIEVRKQKYGSEKKSHQSVSSALLTHDCSLYAKGNCL